MPLKLRRTLSMEDLQNASDDEMDVLLSPSDSSIKLLEECANNGTSQRERIFPFSLITDDTTSRPRPKPNAPIIVPVEMPESDDFFLHGPQAPILKIEGPASDNRINGSCPSISSNDFQSTIPRSKSVRFEEPEEFGGGSESQDHVRNVQAQVNHVTQTMKDNIGRLLEREANLDSLADFTDQLHCSGDIYRQSTEHLRRKLWWRQQKTRLVLTAVFIFCTILLIVPLISKLLQ
ncbi:unnamed protein product [Orchesella dallaii]|uniref:V-SNARE coiled-coil homology domain-containing protein n=1 Tax=Orchesella dallaii TaxID=48710 RepID=A0ABP1Q115_9HEXA